MKNVLGFVLPVLGVLLLNGCASVGSYNAVADYSLSPDEKSMPRKMVWRATLKVEVKDLNRAVEQAANLVKAQGGFVEAKSDYKDESVDMTLRVPADAFGKAVGELGRLGSVQSQRVHGEDVTEHYVDLKERLKNKQLLRNRLQALLDKATTVSDILAIESELNRVQSDLDAMEAKMQQLSGRINFSVINLTFAREQILGPLGYLFKGIYWGLEKLFVIQ